METEDRKEIADKLRNGEYYREARNWYDFMVHDPMWERYMFLIITALAALILFMAVLSANNLLPLRVSIPFIFNSQDITEELPRVSPLQEPGETASNSLLRFLVQHYVKQRESYDVRLMEVNANGISTQSTQEVFNEYQRFMDLRNPQSPFILYERHSTRIIDILSYRKLSNDDFDVEVRFVATVDNKTNPSRSEWVANISFSFDDITVDQETGKSVPIKFVVTKYRATKIRDIK